jgi:BirA family transcriptional regulator, biotin operon repressor / biotin---[acetyl-CoA-carboxylase] ligase
MGADQGQQQHPRLFHSAGRPPWSIFHFPELTSTNDYARSGIERLPDRSVITADVQTAGRGRLGRVWVSPAGGLYATILLKPAPPADLSPRVSLLLADIVCDILRENGIRGRVKWPNDVIVDNRKLAGILPEGGSWPSSWMAIGLGVNLSAIPAVSDRRGLKPAHWAGFGQAPTPDTFLEHLLMRLDEAWGDRRDDPLSPRLQSITGRLWCLGERVSITAGRQEARGTVTGIDKEGGLVLATSSGLQSFHSGELRPL